MTYATLMVHLQVGRSNASLLKVTGALAERFCAGVIGIAACRPMDTVYSDGYVPGNLAQQNHLQIEAEMQAAQEEFRHVLGSGLRFLDWRSNISFEPLADYMGEQARAADLIITATERSGPTIASSRQISIGNLVMHAGRPVLVVPAAVDKLRLDHVIVGWKDTSETRRAISDALPMLRSAERVTVFEIAREDELRTARHRLNDVLDWLGRHGIEANSIASSCTGDDAKGLRVIVNEQGADVIVAGAYGHSRLREWALGGVTRDLLLHPDRCALVSH